MKKSMLVGLAASAVLTVAFPIAAFADSGFGTVTDNTDTISANAADLNFKLTELKVGKASFTWNPEAMNPRGYTAENTWCEISMNDSQFPGMLAGYGTTDGNVSSRTIESGALHAGDTVSVNIKCNNQMTDPTDEARILVVDYTSPAVKISAANAAPVSTVTTQTGAAKAPKAPTVMAGKVGSKALGLYVSAKEYTSDKKTVTAKIYRNGHLYKTVTRSYTGATSGVNLAYHNLKSGTYQAKAKVSEQGKTSAFTKLSKKIHL